jgi:hypothetical protein
MCKKIRAGNFSRIKIIIFALEKVEKINNSKVEG